MKAYNIAFALFILNAVIGAVNGAGVFDTPVANIAKPINESEITEVVGDMESLHSYELLVFAPKILIEMFSIFFSAILGAITIIPMFVQYGVPIYIIGMIQGPIWLVYGWGAVQFLTGRSGKSIE